MSQENSVTELWHGFLKNFRWLKHDKHQWPSSTFSLVKFVISILAGTPTRRGPARPRLLTLPSPSPLSDRKVPIFLRTTIFHFTANRLEMYFGPTSFKTIAQFWHATFKNFYKDHKHCFFDRHQEQNESNLSILISFLIIIKSYLHAPIQNRRIRSLRAGSCLFPWIAKGLKQIGRVQRVDIPRKELKEYQNLVQ